MTKVEAIKRVLEDFNGVATWEQIYGNIERYYPAVKVSRAWQEGIRGVLYREIKKGRYFKKVGLGIFALKDYEEKPKPTAEEKQRMHPFIEGICLELGNFEGYATYTANPSAEFKNNIILANLATLNDLPPFTYPEIIEEARRIDVIWLNNQGPMFPQKVFEVVDSIGTLSEAFNRTLQLLSFRTDFFIIGPIEHQKRFNQKINLEPYVRFKERYKFRNYDMMIKFYEQSIELNKVKSEFFI